MIKLWSGAGKRVKNKKAVVADRPKDMKTAMKQEKIIDFETLAKLHKEHNAALSWYSGHSAGEAVGNEWSTRSMYAQKRKDLKFLSL